VLFRHFFSHFNTLIQAIDQTIFLEQWARWCTLGYDVLLKHGPDELPEDLRFLPALVFQVLAVALLFSPCNRESCVAGLKFAPSQTGIELSTEFSECAVAITEVLGRSKPTHVGVQHGFLRVCWLMQSGDLMGAWEHSGKTVE
jgi:hypothetical protein